MEIKYICDDFLIAFKPHNIPTVPLKNQEADTLLNQVSKIYPEVLTVHGKNHWEGSALHRLDTATEGLVLFARNQKFYDYLQDVQEKDLFVKEYQAICNGKPNTNIEKIETYFRAFGPKGSMVKPETNIEKSDNQRLYTTNVKIAISDTLNTVFQCKITRGFRHQIRSHLAYIGCPIVGDNLYNPIKRETDLQLSCISISFPNIDGKEFRFNAE